MSEGKSVIKGLYYSKEHEWVKVESDDLITIGITDFAQHSLHEITYVEISVEVGTTINAGDECGLVESMKASSEIFTPISGEVLEVNPALELSPEVVNESPYDKGWLMKMKPSNLQEELATLMDAKAYIDYIESL